MSAAGIAETACAAPPAVDPVDEEANGAAVLHVPRSFQSAEIRRHLVFLYTMPLVARLNQQIFQPVQQLDTQGEVCCISSHLLLLHACFVARSGIGFICFLRLHLRRQFESITAELESLHKDIHLEARVATEASVSGISLAQRIQSCTA